MRNIHDFLEIWGVDKESLCSMPRLGSKWFILKVNFDNKMWNGGVGSKAMHEAHKHLNDGGVNKWKFSRLQDFKTLS